MGLIGSWGLGTWGTIDWSDTTVPTPSTSTVLLSSLGHSIKLLNNCIVKVPILQNVLNQYDEYGNIVSLKRIRGEKNIDYKARLLNTMVDIANSSYRGLINGITRELGLSVYKAITINPKRESDTLNFLATDPYISFENSLVSIYSDYNEGTLSWSIDRYKSGGNYETIGKLVDFINNNTLFEASILSGVDRTAKSMCLINQSNRGNVNIEFIPSSTKFKLKNKYLVQDTIYFSNRLIFKTQVSTENDINEFGQYYIDRTKGIVSVYQAPPPKTIVRYQYIQYPFTALASPVIISNINNDSFKNQLFHQILLSTGEYSHGKLTELGVDIMNELTTVFPMYWGI